MIKLEMKKMQYDANREAAKTLLTLLPLLPLIKAK